MGSAFIATDEANASQQYKDAVVAGNAADIVYTNLFTGVLGNYLRASITAAGLDPENLPQGDPSRLNFGSGGTTSAKVWRDIWGCGQGIGALKEVVSVARLVDRLESEYLSAHAALNRKVQNARPRNQK
jgi:nitronate monooxygenase